MRRLHGYRISNEHSNRLQVLAQSKRKIKIRIKSCGLGNFLGHSQIVTNTQHTISNQILFITLEQRQIKTMHETCSLKYAFAECVYVSAPRDRTSTSALYSQSMAALWITPFRLCAYESMQNYPRFH